MPLSYLANRTVEDGHQRKQGADDLVDTVSGTLGLGGGADTILILGKDQLGKFLYGRGRDIEEFNVNIKQDQNGRFQMLGPRTLETPASPERAAVVAALARAGRPMTVAEITKAVSGNQDNIKKLLSMMHRDGEVVKVATGVYKLPNPQDEMPF